MKTLLVLLFVAFILMPIGLSAQTEEWLWARGVGGTGGDATAAIDTDSAGNSYVAGYFHRTVNFGSLSLTTLNTAGTAFVGKVGPTGMAALIFFLLNSILMEIGYGHQT